MDKKTSSGKSGHFVITDSVEKNNLTLGTYIDTKHTATTYCVRQIQVTYINMKHTVSSYCVRNKESRYIYRRETIHYRRTHCVFNTSAYFHLFFDGCSMNRCVNITTGQDNEYSKQQHVLNYNTFATPSVISLDFSYIDFVFLFFCF